MFCSVLELPSRLLLLCYAAPFIVTDASAKATLGWLRLREHWHASDIFYLCSSTEHHPNSSNAATSAAAIKAIDINGCSCRCCFFCCCCCCNHVGAGIRWIWSGGSG